MNPDTAKLIATIRQLAVTVHAEGKLRRKLLPHLDHEPEAKFGTCDEMMQSYTFAALDLQAELVNFMSVAATLPKPYGDMFCFIVYGDLHRRMKIYQKVASKLIQMPDDVQPSTTPGPIAVPA